MPTLFLSYDSIIAVDRVVLYNYLQTVMRIVLQRVEKGSVTIFGPDCPDGRMSGSISMAFSRSAIMEW